MFLRTERLFLRPAWPEDAAELARAIGHEAVVRMLARVPWPYSEDHARSWIESSSAPALPNFLVTLPDDAGRIVGGCELFAQAGQSEVGYWIAPAHWGRGFATEALTGLLSLARALGHSRLVARHAPDNPASARVLRKVGFCPTGRLRPFRGAARTSSAQAPEYALELGDAVPMKRGWTRPAAYLAGTIAA